ncbi:MAG: IS66 family insertion sequence element accessory protein TnpB [Candidatus Xenobiia bacterium LiM19]
MLSLESVQRVYLAPGYTDMRKSINGLAALVSSVFNLDPFSESWFVFSNRERNKVKILRWEHNGFWLHYRRLERGRFRWPSSEGGQTVVISRRQLQWLLDGLNIDQPKAHKKVTASLIT